MPGRPCIALALALGLGTPMVASAQAWLPPKGEASIALGYEYVFVHDHLFARGEREDRGHIHSHALLSELGYSISDRLAFRLGLPFVAAKYTGPRPHQLPIDDGTYHGAFQDFRLEARFLASRGAWAVTPFAALGLPSHDYEFFAHSAVGLRLRTASLGFNIGRRLDPVLPDAYIHLRYAYAFVERVHDIRHDRSNLDLDFGYFVTPSVTLRALGFGQWAHGGVVHPVDGTPLTIPYYRNHDQLAADGHFNVGLGASYAASGSVDIFATGIYTLSGRNAHALSPAVAVGASINFSPAQMLRKRARRHAARQVGL